MFWQLRDARDLFEHKALGARDDHPGLKACLDFLKPGDTLMVWKLDRLCRSLPHLLDIVTGLRDGGVAFQSLTEGMDTNTPHRELLFHIFGALAQYERALTLEQMQAALAEVRDAVCRALLRFADQRLQFGNPRRHALDQRRLLGQQGILLGLTEASTWSERPGVAVT